MRRRKGLFIFLIDKIRFTRSLIDVLNNYYLGYY
jgi:hypothetical protein